MDEVVKGIRALQRKCDSQVGLVEAYRGILAEIDTQENAMLKKYVVTKEAWHATIQRNNKCKQQLTALGCQVGTMQCGREELSDAPRNSSKVPKVGFIMKQQKKENVGAHSLTCTTLGKRVCQNSRMGLGQTHNRKFKMRSTYTTKKRRRLMEVEWK